MTCFRVGWDEKHYPNQSINQSINQLVNPRDVFENTFEAKAKASAFWGQ